MAWEFERRPRAAPVPHRWRVRGSSSAPPFALTRRAAAGGGSMAPVMRQAGRCCAILLIGLVSFPAAAGRSTADGSSGDKVLWVPGVSAPVRIVTDRYGIPHLRAENLPDLYFGWGFVTAR